MSAAQEAMLKATAQHTEAVTDLIWALCWLKELSSDANGEALKSAFRHRLELRRKERPIFHTLCSEIRL